MLYTLAIQKLKLFDSSVVSLYSMLHNSIIPAQRSVHCVHSLATLRDHSSTHTHTQRNSGAYIILTHIRDTLCLILCLLPCQLAHMLLLVYMLLWLRVLSIGLLLLSVKPI
jgi:hypothetical protein